MGNFFTMAAMRQRFNVTTAEGYELKYEVTDAQLKTVECQGLVDKSKACKANLVIPEKVKYNGVDYAVTSIGNGAFRDCSGFTGCLTIPVNTTSIGEAAFGGCGGFTGSLTIGAGVRNIGKYAFYYCKGFIGSLVIPAAVSIGDGAFAQCSGFTGSLTIGGGVMSIGESAFYFCRGFTGSLTIPDNVTSIGEDAFKYCWGFTGNLTIGAGVRSIGSGAFGSCKVNAINVSAGNVNYSSVDGMLLTKDKTTLLQCPAKKSGSLVIPDAVRSIGEGAFAGCNGLTGSLIIPNNVTSIGDDAFSECDGFTGSLMIPTSVRSIGERAFKYCRGVIGHLTIGASVNRIGERAFDGCKVNAINVSAGNVNYSSVDGMLLNKDKTILLQCPARKSGSLVIPAGVRTIGECAFSGCSALTGSLVIPYGVTSIGSSAFSECDGFTGSLTISASVRSIEDEAFFGCTSLTSVVNQAVTPQLIDRTVFQDIAIDTIPLYVPKTSIGAYMSAEEWKYFRSVSAIVDNCSTRTMEKSQLLQTIYLGAGRLLNELEQASLDFELKNNSNKFYLLVHNKLKTINTTDANVWYNEITNRDCGGIFATQMLIGLRGAVGALEAMIFTLSLALKSKDINNPTNARIKMETETIIDYYRDYYPDKYNRAIQQLNKYL